MTAKEMLMRMPEFIDKDAVGNTSATIQYELSEPIYQIIHEGKVSVTEGRANDPDLTVQISDDDLVSLFRGQLNAMSAFMAGKVKVTGDMVLAQRLIGFVDRRRMNELA